MSGTTCASKGLARARRLLAVGLIVVAGTACQPDTRPPAPLPERPPVVDVTMREYRFVYRPPARAGRVVFRARNAGTVRHQLQLLALDDDFPPIDKQLHGPDRRPVIPLAGVLREPGKRGAFAVDLAPGRRYALVCFISDRDGVVHALKGMNAEFRAAAQSAPPRPPGGARSQPEGRPPSR